ncbi:MAG TPA: hypothetical protein VFS81_05870 [Candidatus Binatia bacterium]|nr:hypothetical protein [Candidatus Binatia bacterium]
MTSKKFICVTLGVFIALSFVSALLLAFNLPANAQERPKMRESASCGLTHEIARRLLKRFKT